MAVILEVSNLRKSYADSDFALDDVSFSINYGDIVGFIGENGAGKSTTMSSILGTLYKDSGTIHIFGEEIDPKDPDLKNDIGVVFDDMKLPGDLTILNLKKVFRGIYKNWNDDQFDYYVKMFSLPLKKKVKDFSRGMSMKLSVAIALSHNAKLLILDEATAGLDPTGRDELLDVLQDFVQDQDRGILLSSHITSDIEKIANNLIFIKGGKILLKIQKDELLKNYAILTCNEHEFKEINQDLVVAYKQNGDDTDVLVSDREKVRHLIKKESFSIDEITLLLMRGEKV
ncbi:ABC transporter ATP-binding protein [Siminovitchia sp. FSL H7-0308]|uniref:ABC-2 type transport system ATP-binding protein n=1 Tax=Siminovitchia thermophila TaxID=1245522 RepID=A0ABS2R7Q5_9BACI|nr:ABC transporter ATP-binding protein [Siminovitchia thermophila]MBM7715189.1 ABC-2 type transport system ATP-binding protein [Siminovitchia thermophila]ONK22408.1 multidrug ABC transporter ATP-binding protein [Bacillus sp. VT-16-64]